MKSPVSVAGSAGASFAERNRRMLEAAAQGPRTGTRWGRSTAAFLPGLLVATGVGAAIAQGALAASFNLTNQTFTLRSNQLNGRGIAGYLNTANTYDSTKPGGSGASPAARIGIANATLDGFCGIVTQTIAGVPVYLQLTAGTAVTGTPVATSTTDPSLIKASNLFLETASLQGSQVAPAGSTAYTTDLAHPSSIQNAILGISADTVKLPQVDAAGNPIAPILMPQTSAAGSAATAGSFGLQGAGDVDAQGNLTPGTITVPGLLVQAMDTEISGSLSLPKLKVKLVAGGSSPGCP